MTIHSLVEPLPGSRARIAAEVPEETLLRRMEEIAGLMGAQMPVPGFRPGRAPADKVIKHYGRKVVLDQTLRSSIPGWYMEILGEQGIQPIGEPHLDVQDVQDGGPLRFTIEVAVQPLAQLGQYKGLQVPKRPIRQVTADDVDAEIRDLVNKWATYLDLDRPVQAGDWVVLDSVGTFVGETEPWDVKTSEVWLGASNILPEFREQLVGAILGETRTFETLLPDDYPNDLPGKVSGWTVTVRRIREEMLPALDDAFVQKATEHDTVAELRIALHEKLTVRETEGIEQEFTRTCLTAVIDASTVELPEDLVLARRRELVEQRLQAVVKGGQTRDGYLESVGRTVEELEEDTHAEAEVMLSREAVLAAIVKAEGIEPTDEQLLVAVKASLDDDTKDPGRELEEMRGTRRFDGLKIAVSNRLAVELIVREAVPVPMP